jgi:hypothetical protein
MPGAARGGGACRLFTDQSEINGTVVRHPAEVVLRLLVAREGPTGEPVPLLVLRADPDEREALLSSGRPFFAPRTGRDRVGATHRRTDWEEIHELVTESYRVRAPKKLIALLD